MSSSEATNPQDFVGSRQNLPHCHSRHAWDEDSGAFFCSHPRVHASGDIVNHHVCATCEFWKQPAPDRPRPFPTLPGVTRDGPCVYLGDQTDLRDCPSCRGIVRVKVFACDHESHEETTIRDCQRCYDYEQELTIGSVREWAVAVTTAPREPKTLERTIESLAQAGWRQPLVFAEPESVVPDSLPVVRRQTRLGAWPNTYLALQELYLRQPHADAYLLLQDDVVFCRQLRAYLETVLWPTKRVGVLSVYCSGGYRLPSPGFSEVSATDGVLGALALVFPNFALRSLLSDRAVLGHRLLRSADSLRHVDTVIGRWAARRRLPVLVHRPSLAQHIGDTSVVWPGGRNRGRRTASSFVGEDFDALRLLGRGSNAEDGEPQLARPDVQSQEA